MAREDHGWHDDRPCPSWCVTGEQHLAQQFRSGADFWHDSQMTNVQTADIDENYHLVEIGIGLSQREQVDERGHVRHPVQVVIQQTGWSLTANQAHEFATVLNRLADQAERESADLPSRHERETEAPHHDTT
jgi:hypothetical protein